MLTMNHTIVAFVKSIMHNESKGMSREQAIEEAINYIDNNCPVLLLADAIRMYGPRQQFHFTEHPETHEVSSVKFTTTPDKLKGIKDAYVAKLQDNIPKAAVDELSHPEVFIEMNPDWAETAYTTHLYQDCAWDKWIREMVDVSGRFDDKFVYNNTKKVVDGATFRKDLGPLDNVFFITIAKKLEAEYGITVDSEWFEKHVHENMLKEYDAELAENTWKYIKIPNIHEEIELPEFVPEGELEKAVEIMIEATVLF